MVLLGNILQDKTSDIKLIQLVLNTLVNLTTDDGDNDEQQSVASQNITAQLTALYIENKEHVHAVIQLLMKTHVDIRRAAIRLIIALLSNCTKELEDILMENRAIDVSILVDLLRDKHEVIQNETLLLLQLLTRSNANIKQIMGNGNGFNRLFKLIDNESRRDEDVVEKCLCIIISLLENSASNQSYFYQHSYINRLFRIFEFCSISKKDWPTQKQTNVNLLLKIIRALVSPENRTENTVACQLTIHQCGLSQGLWDMLAVPTIPTQIVTEALNTIGDVVRDNHENQAFVDIVMNTSGVIQQSMLFNLLYTMICDEEKSFSLRISILYCLQCYLYKNESGKKKIVQTLLPQTKTAANQHTMGHFLRSGYLMASWCSGILLSHIVVNSQESKKYLLKAKLAVDQAQTNAKTLMEISIDLLRKSSSSFHIRVAVLIFICSWLSNCSAAVQELVSIENSISYLVSQICAQSIEDDHELLIQSLCSFALGLCLVFNNNQIPSYSSESIKQIINERIGIDLFQEKLQILPTSEYFIKAKEQTQLILLTSNDMILDHEFVISFSYDEGIIRRKLKTLVDPIPTTMTHYNDSLL